MKKLHLIASKDNLRPVMQYIQVKNNKVTVTNAYALASFPDTEVFGFPVENELYFPASQWKMQRFDKAERIARFGNEFTAYDRKGNTLGIIKALNAEEFTKIGVFPNWEAVIPTDELAEIDSIGFDPEIYSDLTETVNIKSSYFMEFRGKHKGIILKPRDQETTQAILLLMPVAA